MRRACEVVGDAYMLIQSVVSLRRSGLLAYKADACPFQFHTIVQERSKVRCLSLGHEQAYCVYDNMTRLYTAIIIQMTIKSEL